MRHLGIGGGIAVAIATAFAFNQNISPSVLAQEQAAISAELATKGVWSSATTYAKDDIVVARGSAWISLKANNKNRVPGQTQPSSATFWQLFARGFNPTGAWSNATKYQPDDLATSGGQTYRAKVTNLNKQTNNVTYWELLVTKGAAGATGPTGPAGPNTGIGDGTQSAPSISFTGDPDTGIFHPSAGSMALVQNGALMLHTFGANNAGFGAAALQSNSSGTDNTAVGYATMYPNSSGSNNTALGSLALGANTTGSRNTGIGSSALGANDTGANNTAVGYQALQNSTTADNTAIGYQALKTQTTGFSNTAVGAGALAATTAGSRNIAIGKDTLMSNTNVDDNIAIGNGALAAFGAGLIGGSGGNVAIGTSALTNVTTARDNIAIGATTLTSNVTGGNNTAVGSFAVTQLTGGGSNTAVGFSTLGMVTTGSNNIALGWGSGTNAGNISDSIFIGNFGDPGDTATIKIGIQGTQTKAFMAGISGVTTANADAVPVMVDSAGQLGVTSSSRRYKYDIETMADMSAMLGKLHPVTFRYKQAQDNGAHPLQYGLIAEEVAEAFPDLAVFNKDGQPETVKYHLLPSFLLAGWQAQQKTIATLNERDRQQAEKIAALEARLARLEATLSHARAASLQQ